MYGGNITNPLLGLGGGAWGVRRDVSLRRNPIQPGAPRDDEGDELRGKWDGLQELYPLLARVVRQRRELRERAEHRSEAPCAGDELEEEGDKLRPGEEFGDDAGGASPQPVEFGVGVGVCGAVE